MTTTNYAEIIKDLIEDYELNSREGDVLEYLLDSKKKGNPVEQVEYYKKAIWYLDRLGRKQNEQKGKRRNHQELYRCVMPKYDGRTLETKRRK